MEVTNATKDMAGGVSSLLTVGEWPWQGAGFGEHSDKPVSTAEALKMSGLDWRTEQEPVYYGSEHRRAEGVLANVRGDTRDILGIVSAKYKPIHNAEAFAFGDALLDYGATIETALGLQGGRRTCVLFRLPDYKILDDEIANFVFIANSHTGLGALSAGSTNVRVVCKNTFDRALSTARRVWKLRHMGKKLEEQLAAASETMSLNNSYTQALKLEAEGMATIKITSHGFDSFLTKLFPFPDGEVSPCIHRNVEENREALKLAYRSDNLANIKGTAWGVIQAVSDVAYHKVPARLTKKYRDSIMSYAMDGHPLIAKAWSMLQTA